jgi:hypothetical protein
LGNAELFKIPKLLLVDEPQEGGHVNGWQTVTVATELAVAVAFSVTVAVIVKGIVSVAVSKTVEVDVEVVEVVSVIETVSVSVSDRISKT